MNRVRSKIKLPASYWINNGKLADEIMALIAQKKDEDPKFTIDKIKKIVLNHRQEFLGEPTFAKVVVELIEKIDTIKTDHKTKLNLILDTAKITINLRNLKTGQVH